MAIEFETPIQFLKGVGPKLGDLLRKRGISRVVDLVEYTPRTYEDRRAVRQMASLEAGQLVSVIGHWGGVKSVPMGRSKRRIWEARIFDQSGQIFCKFFRLPYRGYFERFQNNDKVRVIGKVTSYRGKNEFHHPDLHPVQEGELIEDGLVPIYTEIEGLSSQKIRGLVQRALEGLMQAEGHLKDPYPREFRERHELLHRFEALTQVHLPPRDQLDLFLKFRAPAQRRLIFDEFFALELILAQRRSGVQLEEARPLDGDLKPLADLEASLPFQLTGDQKRTLDEILCDMKRSHPMHRLVQGDVGSGKTLVALLSAVYAWTAGAQSALMAPTEILAEQHLQNAKKWLEPLGMKAVLLTGSQKTAERRQVLDSLREGFAHLAIGTHALIQDSVEFHNLGLVVVDEQHRFGVGQRQRLKHKGLSPHFLVMTATPIPRTLAMTVYGDMDVSLIQERPKGRQTIITKKAFESSRVKVYRFLEEQIKKGRQAYVVFPLVEESEKMDLKNATDEFEKLKAEFHHLRFGLLHGKMKAQEKDSVMSAFRAHELDVLVSTTVIEVGVDVPNATVMIIEHSERFGLSQLHQLRGRVGRGEHQSYCVLLMGHAVSEVGQKRAEIMESTEDGFKIAEADLEIRGPGEFLGTRQSGLAGFKMAHLVRDFAILQEARRAAFEADSQGFRLPHAVDLTL